MVFSHALLQKLCRDCIIGVKTLKKILYLRPDGNNVITGGIKVNNEILQILNNMEDVQVTEGQDSYYWPKKSALFSKMPSFIRSFLFNFKYIKYINDFSQYDFIFVDSRLFPRLLFFLKKLKKYNNHTKIITAHHHYCYLQQQNVVKKIIYMFMEMPFMRIVDKIFVFSKYTYDISIKNKISEEKLTLIELGFDKNNLLPNVSVERRSKDMLFIGSIEPRKGLEFLIKAVNHLNIKNHEFKVHIVGSYNSHSKYYKKLIRLVNRYKLSSRVVFHGRLSDEEVDQLKRKSAFFVFPSLYEGFGMVIAESMIYGLPVIAFNNSAMPYTIVDNFNGLIAKNKNASDLSLKIAYLLNDESIRESLSKGALETSSKLNSNSKFLSYMKKSLDEFINL